MYTGKITLVNGGAQRRSFTWVGDGVQGLIDIITNKDNQAEGQIFNIGNPETIIPSKKWLKSLLMK